MKLKKDEIIEANILRVIVEESPMSEEEIVIKTGYPEHVVKHFLEMINFGETLNDILRRLCIDGTAIVKCYDKYNEEYKRNLPHLRIVDPLNFIIKPHFKPPNLIILLLPISLKNKKKKKEKIFIKIQTYSFS